MKKFKKLFALILSLAMVLGMSVTSFAAQKQSGVADKDDTECVKIEGITGKATVNLYKIAEGKYGDSGKGLIRYNYLYNIEMSEEPTSGEINAAYQKILSNSVTPVDTQSDIDGTYTSIELPAGAYIAIISGTNDGSIYNPLLLTVSYDENGILGAGDVNVENGYMFGSTAVAKRSKPDVDKEMIEGTTPDGDRETASVGDVITYRITPTMPSYPENATNKTFFFADTMSDGLTFIYDSLNIRFTESDQEIVAKMDANEKITFTAGSTTIATATPAKNTEGKINGFYLNFIYDSLLYNEIVEDDVDNMAIGGAEYVYTPIITYQAILNDDALVGDDGNPNDARMYYSNEPNNGSTFEPTPNKPEPDGSVPGVEKKEKEIKVYTYELAFLKTGEGDDAAKLAGAVFGIYTDKECKHEIDVVKTNSEGYAVSSKVEAGTYYIKELVAPTGYHLNDKVYSITANQTSATSTITTETRSWKYTTDPTDTDGVQVGWIDTKGDNDPANDVFYSLYVGGAALEDDVDNMGILAHPVDTSKLRPAYVVYDNTVVTTTSTITPSNGGGTASTIIDVATDDTVGSIPNTKLASLPSTGGIGTTIFTIGGCLIMVVAAALFFASRRKSAK